MGVVTPLLQRWDIRLGRNLPIRHIAYTREAVAPGRQGAYARGEWTELRRAGYNGAGADCAEIDSDGGFLRRAFGAERRKLVSGLRMADHLAATGCASVLEIGAGEMVTAWAIKGRLPEIRCVASDYDPYIVEKCGRLAILGAVEKACVDVNEVDAAFLAPFGAIVAWDVFYAFGDPDLLRFLRKVKEARTTLIICTSQLVGPLRGLSYLVKSRTSDLAGQCRRGLVRDHGFKCSVGHYRRLAAQASMDCRIVGEPAPFDRSGDCYVFVAFR